MRQTIFGFFILAICISEISNGKNCIDHYSADSKIQFSLLQDFDYWDATKNLKLSAENMHLKIVQGTREIQIKPHLWAEVGVVQVQFAGGLMVDFQAAIGRIGTKGEPFPIYRVSLQIADLVNKVSVPGVDRPMSSIFPNITENKQYLRADITKFVEKNLADLGRYLMSEKKLNLNYQLIENGQIVIDLYSVKSGDQTEVNNGINEILSIIKRSAP